jgi:hypothetical protein
VYHPNSHGKVEIAHYSILRIIAQLLEDYNEDTNWTQLINHASYAYNNSYNINLGLIPAQQVYGKDNSLFIENLIPIIPLSTDYLKQEFQQSIKNKSVINNQNKQVCQSRIFKIGDLVRHKLKNNHNDKLSRLYSDLHIIVDQTSPYSFIIKLYDSDNKEAFEDSKPVQYNIQDIILSYDN